MYATPEAIRSEIVTLLTRIQEACRVYPTESEQQRKMTFATIRTAADTLSTVCADLLTPGQTDDVQRQVINITAAIDELSDRFGSDDPGRCSACGKPLAEAKLGGARVMRYCTHCPTDILDAVREISDLTEADIL